MRLKLNYGFWLCVIVIAIGGKAIAAVSVANETLTANWDAETGLTLVDRHSGRVFIKDATFAPGRSEVRKVAMTHPSFGRGRVLEFLRRDGSRDVVMLFSRVPFALIRSTLHNDGDTISITEKIRTFSGVCAAASPDGAMTTLGTGGLLTADKNPGSYAWLAVAESRSRSGIVFGWLTHNRGSGVLFSKIDGRSVRVDAQIDYGRLRIAPGGNEALETLAVGYFDDARLGLEAWADAVAKVYNIHLPPQPVGYCTWYSQPHGGASDEKHLAEQSEFAARHLKPFGFSVIQIDDKWQGGISTNGPKRNFTSHRPDGPYPAGMKAAAENIKSLGLVPGIWFMPFAGTYYDPFFKAHQDWFVKREDGNPYETTWGGTCLDLTHPGAREHLRGVVSRICRDWDYQYIKVDGLWTGTATKQQYVNSGYKDDRIGDAFFDNPDKTNIEAYRDGLKLLREAAGKKVFILGCNGPQNMRSYGGAFGLVDGMRVGPDNGADWKRLTRGTIFGSRHYFLHGRVWYNDPDPVYVRASMPLNHAQLIGSWVAVSGQLNLSSEWFPSLPPERLDILKRTMPGHGLRPRPADIFENDPARLWLLTDSRKSPHRDVIGVFNWESQEQDFDYPLDKLGLDASTEYAAFDYWANTLLPMMKGQLHITVPAESCRIISVRPRVPHPQLLSTSRHVTQGIVDVLEEKWDARKKTLSGRSQVVGGDAYESRIVVEKSLAAHSVEVSAADRSAGVTTSVVSDGNLIRARIDSPTSREVSWSVKFK